MPVRIARTLFAVNVGVGAWVGSIQLCRIAIRSVAVGERKINVAVLVIHCAIFRTVHRRCTNRVSRQSRIHQNIGLVRKGVLGIRRNFRICQRQFKPLTAAISFKLRHEQLAFIQIFVTDGHATAHILRIPDCGAHKLIDVLIAGVTTHVKRQRLSGFRDSANCGFVREATERNTFCCHRITRDRINFNNKAKGVGFVSKILCRRSTARRYVPTREAIVRV